jgi:multiple sugar transport system substrate-binding protein
VLRPQPQIVWKSLLLIAVFTSLTVNSAPTKLRVHTSPVNLASYYENTHAFFRKFEEDNPDIQIEIEHAPLDKFFVMYAANQTPDILRLYGQNVPEFAARGLIQPLEPFLAQSSIKKNRFFPVIVEDSLSYKGELYSVSWGVSVTSLFVNLDRYHEAGLSLPNQFWQWEKEGVEAARRLSVDIDGDNVLDRYFLQPIHGGTSVYAFMNMAGSRLFSDPYEYIGDAKEAVEGLQFLCDFMNIHKAMPQPGASGGPWSLPAGTIASHVDGSWYVTNMIHQELPFSWTIGTMPSLRGQRGTSIWPETPWAIPTGVAHPELSWRVIEYIASAAGQDHVTRLGLAMPPLHIEIARTTFAKTYPNLLTSNIVDLALAPFTQTIPVAPATARSLLDGAISAVMRGHEPARQALGRIRPQVEAAIAEFTQKLVVR